MKTLKKLFSVSAIVALLGTLAPMYAFGANYSDELNEAYAYAYKNGITTMKTIDAADMYGSLTRVAMAKMIANYATTVLGLEPDTSAKCTFTDVTAALDAQYDNGVTKACQLGLMGQNITAFRPNDLVTRAEFGTTLSRALNAGKDELKDMNAADPYYKEHLNFLKSEGIMTKIDNPNMTEVRGYVMLMMMRADDSYTPAEGCTAEELLKCITADDYDACIAACTGPENPEEPTNPGYAKVTTKAASTQTVALNAVEKKIGTVTLTAGENDTTVTNIEITKSGLGDPDDISAIQLMKNGEYVTNQANGLTSKKTATLRFSPKLVIKAGKSETFDVVVSLDGEQANGQHDFSVTAVTVANGSFGGTPAKLGSLVTTNYSVGTVEVDIEGEALADAGEENVELATITLEPSVEAVISSITVTSNKDELNKTLSNVKAYIDDEVVGKVTVNDETISIEGLKETVKKDLVITLKGDVIYVGRDITSTSPLELYIEDNHINAVETNTNERMASESDDEGATIVVNGIDLTLKNLVKKTQKVAPGTDDVVLLDLEMSAGTDLEITKYYLDLGDAFPFDFFEDGKVTLYVDGINYDITADDVEDGVYSITSKKESFSISAGDKISIQVKGNSEDEADDTISALTFGVTEVKNMETNKTIEEIDIHEAGHKTMFAAGAISVKDTLKTSNNLLEEGTTSEVLGFSVKANNEKVTLKEVKVTLAYQEVNDITTGDPISYIEKVALYKKGSNTELAKVEDDDVVNGDLTFSINQSITADTTSEYVLKATLDDGTVAVLGADVAFTLKSVSYKAASAPSASDPVVFTEFTVSEEYQVSSTKPTIKLTKNGNKIEVEITNGSAYDMDLVDGGFALKVIGVVSDGSNILNEALGDAADWSLEDENGNSIDAADVTFTSNIAIVEFDASTVIDSAGSEKFVVVMPEAAAIESDYYKTEEKLVAFYYVEDDETPSSLIEAEYNGGTTVFSFLD